MPEISPSDLHALGQFIHERRAQLALTQIQLAERIGWTKERISVLETGKHGLPSLPVLAQLADALDCLLADVLAAAGYPITTVPLHVEGGPHASMTTLSAVLDRILAIDMDGQADASTQTSTIMKDVMGRHLGALGMEELPLANVLESIVQASPDHFYLYDREGRHIYASPAAALACGIDQEDFIGKTWRDLGLSADMMVPLDAHREDVFATGRSWRGEIGVPSPDGDHAVLHEYVLSPVREADNEITSVMASLRDISERKQEEASLQYQVVHDSLTGLPNRTLLYDRLQQGLFAAKRHHSSLAVLLMDLDQFKQVNDTFGHAAGDVLLQGVGPRWKALLRSTDTLARLGGDEFVVLLPDTGRIGAQDVVEKLESTTTDGFPIENEMVRVAVSIGVAVYPDDGTDAVTLLHFADDAMYGVKTDGTRPSRRGLPVLEDAT